MDNYNNAYAEVYTILNCLNREDYNKIDTKVLQTIERCRNRDYEYNFDCTKDIHSQEYLPETRAILFNIFRDYLATPKQKEKIIRYQAQERQRNEEAKKEKYPVDIFKKNM